MAMYEYQTVCAGKKKGETVLVARQGNKATFDVGRLRMQFIMQHNPVMGRATDIVHWQSGQRVCGIGLPMDGWRHSIKDRAQISIARIVDRVGEDKILSVLDAAPVINNRLKKV